MKSRSNAQLMGEMVDDIDDCDPIKTNKDLGDDHLYAFDGVTKLVPEDAAFPCGLVAKSFFTDKFVSFTSEKTASTEAKNYKIDDSEIAWDSDVEYKFKNLDQADWNTIQWMDVEDRKLPFLNIFDQHHLDLFLPPFL